ncbi:hypothetical protein E2C01_008145 [Portunus trituberculatus]|uniref:Uncharacterized protein n=1 Tax=Portunus trituberculatus TaxID=210409 RepID=A0A5B7D1J8_PORTR|nr:hypothetical protein [Portunus trituberculatus]
MNGVLRGQPHQQGSKSPLFLFSKFVPSTSRSPPPLRVTGPHHGVITKCQGGVGWLAKGGALSGTLMTHSPTIPNR